MLSWGGGKPPPRPHPLHKTTDFDGKNNPGGLLHTTLDLYHMQPAGTLFYA